MVCVCVCETGGKKVGDTEEGEGAGERKKRHKPCRQNCSVCVYTHLLHALVIRFSRNFCLADVLGFAQRFFLFLEVAGYVGSVPVRAHCGVLVEDKMLARLAWPFQVVARGTFELVGSDVMRGVEQLDVSIAVVLCCKNLG